MDLTPEAVVQVVHPTAAFAEYTPPDPASETSQTGHSGPWASSELNPKNRIDSLTPVRNPKWRIDGGCGMGTQFYTVPLFISPCIPLRVDTFIPKPSQSPSDLQRLLDLGATFSFRDSRIVSRGVSQHILRALEHYTATHPEFESEYRSLPFGSQILFDNLDRDVRRCRIKLVRCTQLEHELLSLKSLARLVPEIPLPAWPAQIDVTSLNYQRQLHDSVCIVTANMQSGPRTMILKALTSESKYIYHEIVSLLTLPSHPNIIRPLYLATKKCGFGGKTGVIGMLQEYHAAGTLRDILPRRALQGTLHLKDQLRWAKQLTSALVHIRSQGRHYSDLRLDNILLSDSDDVVLVDFEQRGVWCSFSAPEIAFLDYIVTMATSDDGEMPAEKREEYRGKLERYVPGWRDTRRKSYVANTDGYALGWFGLSAEEKESAMVYMLGRVLWCIFEGVSMPERAVWRTCRLESELTFPDYSRTPREMRRLIDACTVGRIERGHEREPKIVREGSRVVLRDGDGTETAEMVQKAAKVWWKAELEVAEKFLEDRYERKKAGDFRVSFERPKLEEVLRGLECWKV